MEVVTEEDFRCAPWTLRQGVDPVGSATPFDALLLVEWPLPWPKDVSEIGALADAVADPRATVMAVVPQDTADGHFRIVHHRRVATHRFAGVDHRVPLAEVPALLGRLLDDVTTDHLDLPSAVGEAPTDVLVCGHGRRDPCCGRWGTLLQVEMAARLPDVWVWRCSHTGGHRYVPTAITLPDGRVWAYADADLVEGVVRRTADVADVVAHVRGSVAVGMWAQPVERELFAAYGWSWLDAELTDTSTEVASDSRSAWITLSFRAADGSTHRARADVVVTRELPVLVCGEPPEHATKSSLELAVQDLQID